RRAGQPDLRQARLQRDERDPAVDHLRRVTPGRLRRSNTESPPSGEDFMIAPATKTPSMNEANDKDPFNNNSYGTLVDHPYKLVSLPVLYVNDFNERIIRGYGGGYGEKDLPADPTLGPSLMPARTAPLPDGRTICSDIPP